MESLSRMMKRQSVRAAIAALMLLVTTLAAYYMGNKIHVLLLSPENGDVRSGYAWATIAAAVAAVGKHITELVTLAETAYEWVRGKSDLFFKPRTFAGFWLVCLSLTLGFKALPNLPKAKTSIESSEELSLTIVRVSPDTTYLSAPTLVFPKGKLRTPNGSTVTGDIADAKGLFLEQTLTLTEGQKRAIAKMSTAIRKFCDFGESKKKLSVLGFASDAPFLDQRGAVKPDSNALNLHLSNARAEVMAAALRETEDPVGGLEFVARRWSSHREMVMARDKAFQSLQITSSGDIDHRSALIVSSSGLECGYLPVME